MYRAQVYETVVAALERDSAWVEAYEAANELVIPSISDEALLCHVVKLQKVTGPPLSFVRDSSVPSGAVGWTAA